jgi:hypothetical protein
MKWTFFIKHKMAAAGLLAMVIGVVLLNNISEQKNSDDLNDAFSSMYEDRLMAESYILGMYENLHEVNELSETHRNNPTAIRTVLAPVITDLNNTIALYRETKLTLQEEVEFAAFTDHAAAVTACAASGSFDGCRTNAEEALHKLAVLSDIQVKEGARLKDNSQRIYSSSMSSSQFELAMLVVIGVLIQALVFTTKTIQQTSQQKVGVN